VAKESCIMGIINMIKSLFRSKGEEPAKREEQRNIIEESDFIDYDGMGNQGRFPVNKKKRK